MPHVLAAPNSIYRTFHKNVSRKHFAPWLIIVEMTNSAPLANNASRMRLEYLDTSLFVVGEQHQLTIKIRFRPNPS